MRRGEIWTVAAGSGYVGKSRPAVIVQDDRFDSTASVTVCPCTTVSVAAALIRPVVEPNPINGFAQRSSLMVDKIMTVPRTKVGERIGQLGDEDMLRVNRALIVFLGLAG